MLQNLILVLLIVSAQKYLVYRNVQYPFFIPLDRKWKHSKLEKSVNIFFIVWRCDASKVYMYHVCYSVFEKPADVGKRTKMTKGVAWFIFKYCPARYQIRISYIRLALQREGFGRARPFNWRPFRSQLLPPLTDGGEQRRAASHKKFPSRPPRSLIILRTVSTHRRTYREYLIYLSSQAFFTFTSKAVVTKGYFGYRTTFFHFRSYLLTLNDIGARSASSRNFTPMRSILFTIFAISTRVCQINNFYRKLVLVPNLRPTLFGPRFRRLL